MRQISKFNKSKSVIITFLTVMGTEKKKIQQCVNFCGELKKIKKTLRYKTAIFDLPWSLCLKVDIGYKTFILPLSINPALSHTNMLFAPHLVCWDLVITFRRIVPLLCILISQIRVQHAAVILHNQTWRQSSYSKLPVRLRFPFRSWGSEFSQNIHMLSSRGHLQPL